MAKADKSLDPKIIAAAKEEFLEKGYEKASTNAICQKAGITWGALKNRYSDKDGLFCALVSPAAEEFKEMLRGANDSFHEQTQEEQERSALHSDSDGAFFVNYVYDHFEVFWLLLACAGGSSYEKYMDELVSIIEASTIRFMKETRHQAVINGRAAGEKTIHILISSYLYGLFEPVMHNMTKAEAVVYVEELKYFFDVGWADILKISQS